MIQTDESKLFNAAPNPVLTGKTAIEVFINEQDATKAPQLKITNLMGKQIAVYKLEQGLHTIDVNMTGFQPGMYHYSLYIGDRMITTKKLVIRK